MSIFDIQAICGKKNRVASKQALWILALHISGVVNGSTLSVPPWAFGHWFRDLATLPRDQGDHVPTIYDRVYTLCYFAEYTECVVPAVKNPLTLSRTTIEHVITEALANATSASSASWFR